MNARIQELVASDGRNYTLSVIEAINPKSNLPCIYAGILHGGQEIGAVRFLFPVMYVLTVPFDWPNMLLQSIQQFQTEQWLNKILVAPGIIHETLFQTAP